MIGAPVVGEYRHPVAGNFFGTISTIALCFAIASRRLQGKIDVAHAVPAWFIPGVATLDIAVAGVAIPMPWAHVEVAVLRHYHLALALASRKPRPGRSHASF